MQQKKRPAKDFLLYLRALGTKITVQMSNTHKQADYLYFGCHVADAGNSWVPPLRWITCNVSLIKWVKGKKNSMPPVVLMIWRGPISHLEDCCFCLRKIEDSKKSKVKIQYPNVPTAKNSVAHREEQPIPKTRSFKKSHRNDKLHLPIQAV
jgi:hypothetical protein